MAKLDVKFKMKADDTKLPENPDRDKVLRGEQKLSVLCVLFERSKHPKSARRNECRGPLKPATQPQLETNIVKSRQRKLQHEINRYGKSKIKTYSQFRFQCLFTF